MKHQHFSIEKPADEGALVIGWIVAFILVGVAVNALAVAAAAAGLIANIGGACQ
jgi:hypothetical protein